MDSRWVIYVIKPMNTIMGINDGPPEELTNGPARLVLSWNRGTQIWFVFVRENPTKKIGWWLGVPPWPWKPPYGRMSLPVVLCTELFCVFRLEGQWSCRVLGDILQDIGQGLVNVPIKHHPTIGDIRDVVSNRYLKGMFKIKKKNIYQPLWDTLLTLAMGFFGLCGRWIFMRLCFTSARP